MKSIFFSILVVGVLLAGSSTLHAQSGGGYGYTINPGGTTITITSYSGPGGAVSIPTNINGYAVTGIGAMAFYQGYAIKGITIPSGVAGIGSNAFAFCLNMTNIVIPAGVTNIGAHAFEQCRGLSYVIIPPSVASLGDYAFTGCSNMPIIILEGNAPTADSTVFSSNNPLTAYYFTTTSGWSNTFAGILAVGVSGLANNYIYTINPGNPSDITLNLNYIKDAGALTIPSNINNLTVTSIGDGAFQGNTQISSVVIPATVTNIGNFAFYGCEFDNYAGLTSVTIQGAVANIGAGAFEDCVALQSIVLPDGLTNIGNYAFAYCYDLAAITIPASVTSLGEYSFAFGPYYTSQSLYFLGNAPAADATVFSGEGAVAYYRAEATGWSNSFAGIRTQANAVSFSYGPLLGWGPLQVQFQASGSDSFGVPITNWSWSFGDGSTGTGQNPSHTYTSYGSFDPTLKATNNIGGAVVGLVSSPAIEVMNPTAYTNVVLNGGFETGGFDYWNEGAYGWDYWVNPSGFNEVIGPHSGQYNAIFECDNDGPDAYLSQSLRTVPGANYLLSFWVAKFTYDDGDLYVLWDGNRIYDSGNDVSYQPTWTNLQFSVSATQTNTVLEFDLVSFEDTYFFDDISVVAVPPAITSINLSGTNLVLYGTNGVAGAAIYVLTSTNVAQPINQWIPVATNVLGASGNFSITATNVVNPNAPQQFYTLHSQ